MNSTLYYDSIEMKTMTRLNKINILNNNERVDELIKTGYIHKDIYKDAVKLYEIANEVYPNECDLQLSLNIKQPGARTLFRKDHILLIYDLDLVIHFPLFVVTNSQKEEITVKDFFFRIELAMENNKIIINGFNGSRTTFSYADYTSNYRWSHLSGTANKNYPPIFTNFCFGDGDIPKLEVQFNQTSIVPENTTVMTREQIFRLLLLNIDSYLKWESLEGGPHHKMSEVFTHGNVWNPGLVVISTIVNHCSSILELYIGMIDCDIIFSNGMYQVVDNQKFDLSLANIINSEFTSSNRKNLLFKRGSDGTLYEISTIKENNSPSDIPLVFKEKEYFCVIESDAIIIDNSTYYTNPLLKQYAKSTLDYIINYESTKSSFIKRLQD